MFAVIYIPQFALQAVLRHQPELWSRPAALVDPERTTPVVCDLTQPARHAGVCEGLSSVQAMARCGSVTILHRRREAETAATEAALQLAYGFSPNIEATAPGIVTLDLRGLMNLAAADSVALLAWAGEIRVAYSKQGFQARIGVGPSPNLARHAARWSEGIEMVRDPKEFMASLPVAALEPSTDVSTILYKWGVRTVGEFLMLGQEAVMDRLGLEALALFSAASTSASRPLHLVRPSEVFEDSFDFDPPIETLEPLLFLLRRFVDQFCARLESTGLVADTLKLRLRLESGEPMESLLGIPQPTREPEILFRSLHTHLEGVRTEAAVCAVELKIDPTQARQKQFGLFEAVLRDPQRFQETLARLAALLGADRVGTPVRENSHRADAFKLVPPDFENVPAADHKSKEVLDIPALRRLRPAAKAMVELKNNSIGLSEPVSIRCSAAKGRLKMVVGPWRASGHWWEPGAWLREEWDVSTQTGQVVRIAQQGGEWAVEGILD